MKNLVSAFLLCCCLFNIIAGDCPTECRCDTTIFQVTCTGVISNADDLDRIAKEIANDTEELILNKNNLTTFNVHFKLVNLLILDLSQNLFSTIPTGLADKFPKLEVLKLDANKIEKLTTKDFNGLGNLTKITLNDNDLTTLDDGVFQKLINLKQLVIKSNQISSVSKDAFKGLSKLVNLDLSVNAIPELKPGIFDHFKDTELDVSFPKNQLKGLPNGLFKKLKEIKMLEVSSNNISFIDDEAFKGVTISELLNLLDNKLQEIPVNALMNSSIAIIQAFTNPIKCTCELRKLFPKFKNKLHGNCKDGNSTIDFNSQLSKDNQDEITKALCTRCEVNNTCLNGAECIPIGKVDLRCKCKQGFFGSNCHLQSPCVKYPCMHSGTCVQINATTDYECFCKDAYYGKDCELVRAKEGLSDATIAGIILGILFLIILIIIILIFSKKSCEQRRNISSSNKDIQNPNELTSLKKNDPDV